MTPEQHQRAMELFDAACELEPQYRSEHVDSACPDDPLVRTQVLRMLDEDARPAALSDHADRGRAVEALAAGIAADAFSGDDALPERLGQYRIIRKIGEGGMGVVYQAAQDKPNRVVALKVLRPLLSNPSLVRRFEFEAEALGRLHHPAIAQVYEAGTARTPFGVQPFYAMEFIQGLSLLDHVRQYKLGSDERLRIFAASCDGVHSAHQHGVIHRDLKPGNIIVDASLGLPGQPKILDFGIARTTDADVKTATLQTDVGQLLGTVPYMSPEQARGDPRAIDARSDVYALGVILFELLAERLPYEVDGRSIPDAVRVIIDGEPTRLGRFNPRFRGDLDTIAAKALEKNKERRYVSAAELAADVRRYLNNEPIIARPATTWYQLSKFARRHKELVAGVSAAFVILVVGLVGVSWFAVREAQQRRLAQSNEAQARWAAYRNAITAAASALRVHDVASARSALESAPPERRGWEWRHFFSQLDDSLLSINAGMRSWGITFDDAGHLLNVLSEDLPPKLARWEISTGRRLTEGELAEAWRRWYGANRTWEAWRRSLSPGAAIWIPDGRGGLTAHDPSRWGLSPDVPMFCPILSVDARQLAFQSSSTGEIWVIEPGRDHDVARRIGRCRANPILQFSADARRLFSADASPANSLWDCAGGPQVGELIGHRDRVNAVDFSLDGRRIVTGSWDTTLRTWDATTLAPLAVGYGHSNTVDSVAFAPDCQRVASGSRDGTVRLWEAETLAPQTVLHGHRTNVDAVAFSPDGSRLASIDKDGWIRVWDATREAEPDVLRGHDSYVYPVVFSPDGKWLASGGWDRAICLWDPHTRERLAVLTGHGAHIFHLAFNLDGSALVSVAADRTLRVWDVRSGKTLASHSIEPTNLTSVAFLEDGIKVLLPWKPGSTLSCWNPSTNEASAVPLSALATVKSPLVSPDGTLALSYDSPCVIEVSSGKKLYGLEERNVPAARASLALAFSPDGRRLAGPTADHALAVFRARTGEPLAVLRGHTESVFAVAFSPDGSRLASAGRDQTIRLWSTESFEEVAQLRGHTSYVWSLAWSPDGAMLVSGSGDHTVRIWDTVQLPVRLAAVRERHQLMESLPP